MMKENLHPFIIPLLLSPEASLAIVRLVIRGGHRSCSTQSGDGNHVPCVFKAERNCTETARILWQGKTENEKQGVGKLVTKD